VCVRAPLARRIRPDGSLVRSQSDDRALDTLHDHKARLELELRAVETGMKQVRAGEVPVGAILATTKAHAELVPNVETGTVDVVVSTNNDAVIKNALVFALDGGVFPGESRVAFPVPPAPQVRVPLRPLKHARCELRVQAVVGARAGSKQYHVFELSSTLPKFATFVYRGAALPRGVAEPAGRVTFTVDERAPRLAMWVAQAFCVTAAAVAATSRDPHAYEAWFSAVAPTGAGAREVLGLRMEAGAAGGATVTILADSMDLAGELLQDVAAYFGVRDVDSTADFPEEMARFRTVVETVDACNAIRQRLTAEIADSSNAVKMLVVRAEDARALGDMTTMRRAYAELMSLNNGLVGEYVKRANNHQQLLAALKDVNLTIQKASRLRGACWIVRRRRAAPSPVPSSESAPGLVRSSSQWGRPARAWSAPVAPRSRPPTWPRSST
jgi:Bardet-Biedl syndrome 2 protein